MENESLGPIELARKSGVSLQTIYKHLWTGKLPAERHYGRWIIAHEQAESFIQKCKARQVAQVQEIQGPDPAPDDGSNPKP